VLTVVLISCFVDGGQRLTAFTYLAVRLVTLEDTQKFLGVRISGRPVIGHCNAAGWRDRVEVFLGRELPPETPSTRSSGVLISWLRQNFG
jgi:hypothetical protein